MKNVIIYSFCSILLYIFYITKESESIGKISRCHLFLLDLEIEFEVCKDDKTDQVCQGEHVLGLLIYMQKEIGKCERVGLTLLAILI